MYYTTLDVLIIILEGLSTLDPKTLCSKHNITPMLHGEKAELESLHEMELE